MAAKKSAASRYAKDTHAHVTADRSEGSGRRRGTRTPIAEGGTAPHLGTCKTCGAPVIYHREAGTGGRQSSSTARTWGRSRAGGADLRVT